ncbi:MAG: type II secretion system F family protein [Tabrizicola sp.]|jgi:general secretion pathway protein F|nr:type II secretion system F family protein [Tabrizicola sp.]
MPRFRYTAYSSDGVREDGALDVATEAQAWDKLTSLGLTVVDLLAEGSTPQPRAWPQVGLGKRLSLSTQADLADQLAVLFAARLSAMQVVETIEQGAVLPSLQRMFRRIGQLMADGQSFPDALSDAGEGLQPLFVSLARIGETSGDPAPLMKSLATSLRRQQKLAAQISGALVYPMILIAGGFGILILMALYLAPQLASIFSSVDKPVPSELQVFIAAGEVLQNWWLELVILCLAGIGLLPALLKRYTAEVTTLLHRLPVLGPVARDASLARLSRSVQIMLTAGVPLAPTLHAVAAAAPADPLARQFGAAAEAIETGGPAREVFATAPGFPPVFRALFAIGERTNTLPQVMDSVATALEDQTERKAQRAVTLLTPALTLIIGGGIAALVYAVMSALLTVNDLAF